MQYNYTVSHALFEGKEGGRLNIFDKTNRYLLFDIPITGETVDELRSNANEVIANIEKKRG